jgi:hypothetical protein
LVAAFFAVPAMAQCDGPNFEMPDMTFGNWPANTNIATLSSGTQRALSAAGGDASNDLIDEDDQEAGMMLTINIGDENVLGTDDGWANADYYQLQFTNQVTNIKRVDSGDQTAFAFGRSIAKNRISVNTKQCVDTVDINEAVEDITECIEAAL